MTFSRAIGALGGGAPGIGDAAMRVGVDISGVRPAMQQAVGEVKRGLNEAAGEAGRQRSGASAALGVLKAAAVGTGIAVASGLAMATTAAIGYESAFAGVVKTVNATPPQLEQLRRKFRELATEIPISASEFARLGEAAGALGVDFEDIEEFTRVTALLGVTTNVASDQAATSLGQLSNVLDMTAADYERFGSALVQLGNNGASTEAQILEIASRSGAVGHNIGLSTQAILGFASATADLGIEVEAGGSALQFLYSSLAAMMADEPKLARLAETIGITSDEFRSLFARDAQGAIVEFFRALGQLDPTEQIMLLDDLGLSGIRTTRAFVGLAGNIEGVTESLENANRGWEESTALQIEADKRFATTASRLTLMRNRIGELFLELGDRLLPALNRFITFLMEDVPAAARFMADVFNRTLGPALSGLMGSLGNLWNSIVGVFTDDTGAVVWGDVVGGVFERVAGAAAVVVDWLSGIIDAIARLLDNGVVQKLLEYAAIWAGIRVTFGLLQGSVRWLTGLGRGTLSFLSAGLIGGPGAGAAGAGAGAAAVGGAAASAAAQEEARIDAVVKEQVRQQREAFENARRRDVAGTKAPALDAAGAKLSSAATELATQPPARIAAAASEFSAATTAAAERVAVAQTGAATELKTATGLATKEMGAALASSASAFKLETATASKSVAAVAVENAAQVLATIRAGMEAIVAAVTGSMRAGAVAVEGAVGAAASTLSGVTASLSAAVSKFATGAMSFTALQQEWQKFKYSPASGLPGYGPPTPQQIADAQRLRRMEAERAWAARIAADVARSGRLPGTMPGPGTFVAQTTSAMKQAMTEAYQAVQKSYGGITFDPATGQVLRPTPGRASGPYVSAVGETKSLSFAEGADIKKFNAAVEDFKRVNAGLLSQPGHMMGMFRDDLNKRIDLDVAKIDDKIEDAIATQQARMAAGFQANGAYDIASGQGVFANPATKAAYAAQVVQAEAAAQKAAAAIAASTALGLEKGINEPSRLRGAATAGRALAANVSNALVGAVSDMTAPYRAAGRGVANMSRAGARIATNVTSALASAAGAAVSAGGNVLRGVQSGVGSVFGAAGRLIWPALLGQLALDLAAAPIGDFVSNMFKSETFPGLVNLGAEIRDKGIIPAIGTLFTSITSGINPESIANLAVSEVNVDGVKISRVDAVRMGFTRTEMEQMFAEEVTLEGRMLQVTAARAKLTGVVSQVGVAELEIPNVTELELPPIPGAGSLGSGDFIPSGGFAPSIGNDIWQQLVDAGNQMSIDVNQVLSDAIGRGAIEGAESVNVDDIAQLQYIADYLQKEAARRKEQTTNSFRQLVYEALEAGYSVTPEQEALLTDAEIAQIATLLTRNVDGSLDFLINSLLSRTAENLALYTGPPPEEVPVLGGGRVLPGVDRDGGQPSGSPTAAMSAQFEQLHEDYRIFVRGLADDGNAALAEAATSWLTRWGEQITEAGPANQKAKQALIDAMVEAGDVAAGSTWEEVINSWNTAMGLTGQDTILSMGQTFGEIVAAAAESGVPYLKGKVGKNMLEVLQGALESDNLSPEVRTALEEIISKALVDSRSAVDPVAMTSGEAVGAGLIEGIEDTGPSFRTKAEDVVRGGIKWSGTLDKDFHQSGGDIITGVNAGVTGARPGYLEALDAAVSPPSVFGGMYEAGKRIMEQIQQGMRDQRERMVDAMNFGLGLIGVTLPKSPVRDGPLKHPFLPNAGRNILLQVADGVRSASGEFASAVSASLGAADWNVPAMAPSFTMPDLPAMAAPVALPRAGEGAAAGGGGDAHIAIDRVYLQNARDEDQLVERLAFLTPGGR